MAKKSRIIIPCRIAYLNCWEPCTLFGGKKYSLIAIIDKKDLHTLEMINETLEYVKNKSVAKWGGSIPANCKSPLHDGDVEKPDNPIFRGCYYIAAKSKQPPQIVDQNVQPITNPNDFYSGCYGNVSIVFYGYNVGGNKGIASLLGNIQKIKDGLKTKSSTISPLWQTRKNPLRILRWPASGAMQTAWKEPWKRESL